MGTWETNPLVTNIRTEAADMVIAVADEERRRRKIVVSPFDVIIQTMIVCCSYNPRLVWRGPDDLLAEIIRLVEIKAVREARELMDDALERGEIMLNRRLVARIARHQANRLQALMAEDYAGFQLPGLHSRSLAGFMPGSKIVGLKRVAEMDSQGTPVAVASEALSGREVTFRAVRPEVSRAYAKGLHYIHESRDDEIMAFGAFLPGEDAPFAWVSYSRPGRQYKVRMLSHIGVGADNALELTRAWQSASAPKNALSMLYAYAHASLQNFWLETQKTQLHAIITAVNPNLGFVGSAFRAVGFGLIGTKVTEFGFQRGEHGRRCYITRRKADREQKNKADIVVSQFPLLDTHELGVLLEGSKRIMPKPATILHYSASTYSV